MHNEYLKAKRIRVEMFFGALTKIFAITAQLYIYKQENLRADFTSYVMLTNWHIELRSEIRSETHKEFLDYYYHWLAQAIQHYE